MVQKLLYYHLNYGLLTSKDFEVYSQAPVFVVFGSFRMVRRNPVVELTLYGPYRKVELITFICASSHTLSACRADRAAKFQQGGRTEVIKDFISGSFFDRKNMWNNLQMR